MSDSTWLDRAIGWVSPERGLSRVRARRMTAALAYEGARTGRRTEGWLTTPTSADAEIHGAMGRLRDRARDLVRNNAYAARALDVRVANTIGTGIEAEVENARLQPLWDAFVEECDADGVQNFHGLQALAERTRSESGEVLVQFVPGPGSLRVPLQLRVMEPDFIDESRNGLLRNGNQILRGIEYDRFGRVVNYWLFSHHPGDASFLSTRSLESRPVPAEDVIHLFRKLRAGQTRGVSDFAPVILAMRDLDDYDDAEIMRKKIEACLAAFVTSPQGSDATNLGPVKTDAKGRIETLFPAMIEYLRPGESVTTAEPKQSGGYADFQRFGLRRIAAGYGVPYELMTGDLSQVNYSSYRAGLIDFRRRIEQDQWHLWVPRFADRVWRRFHAEARVMSGSVGRRSVSDVKWTPPRFEMVDPLKETQGELESVLAGFDTWEEVVRKRGWTSEEQLDRIERWQKELDRRGITLKSDPRVDVGGVRTREEEQDDDSQAA